MIEQEKDYLNSFFFDILITSTLFLSSRVQTEAKTIPFPLEENQSSKMFRYNNIPDKVETKFYMIKDDFFISIPICDK